MKTVNREISKGNSNGSSKLDEKSSSAFQRTKKDNTTNLTGPKEKTK